MSNPAALAIDPCALAFGATTTGVVVADARLPDAPLIDVNPAFERMTGYARAEVVGRNCRFLQGPDTDPAAIARIRTALAAGREVVETLLNCRKDGTPFWNELRITPVLDGEGRLTHFVGVQTDVTERRAAEAARDRLAAIVESTGDAVIGETVDGIVTDWNRGAERLYGWTAAEAVGRPIAILAPPDRPTEIGQLRSTVRAGGRIEGFETERVTRDGRVVPVSVTISPVHDDAGRIVGMATIARDVTERKRVEAELRAARDAAEDANRLKSQFLSTISHELRTPLTAILGYGSLLLEGLDGDLLPEQRADIERMVTGGENLLTLVDEVLDLSRIEAGRFDVMLGPVDVGWVVAQACADVAPQAAAKGIELVIEVPTPAPVVLADPRRTRQILVNLLGNAVKFTDTGRVVVTSRATGDGMVDVRVLDTGVGIAPEHLARVFDEFWQADGSRTRRFGGAGLGLAIARKMAEVQGGTIVPASTPGHGSSFTLVLPQADLAA